MKTEFEKLIDDWQDDYEYIAYDIAYSITEKIGKIMKSKNIKNKDLAKRMNVDPSYITKLLSGYKNMTIETIAKVAVALNMKYTSDFIDETDEIEEKNDEAIEMTTFKFKCENKVAPFYASIAQKSFDETSEVEVEYALSSAI